MQEEIAAVECRICRNDITNMLFITPSPNSANQDWNGVYWIECASCGNRGSPAWTQFAAVKVWNFENPKFKNIN